MFVALNTGYVYRTAAVAVARRFLLVQDGHASFYAPTVRGCTP